MEDAPWPPSRLEAALADAGRRDHSFGGGEILGSMCTQPLAVAAQAYAQFLATNLGDPEHFPGTAALEAEVLADLAQLAGGADPAAARFLTGGTEANILACYLARETTARRTILCSEAAHFSFDKAARLLGMQLRRVACGPDQRSDPAALAAAMDDDTAIVVAIAGSTELGLVDDVPAIAAAAAAAGAECHVDAAFGGYVLPFLDAAPPWDLRVAGVTSFCLDPHKMGQAPVPAGALVLADASRWQRIAVATDYVSTTNQSTLMGTRPGAAVAATWAAHRALGRKGYRASTATCMRTTQLLADGLLEAGAELVAPPQLNVVTFRLGDADTTRQRLAAAGFRCNLVPRFAALRIVVGPHVTADVVARFLEVLRAA